MTNSYCPGRGSNWRPSARRSVNMIKVSHALTTRPRRRYSIDFMHSCQHYRTLADLFIPTPSRLPWGSFSHTAYTARRLIARMFPPMCIARYSFIRELVRREGTKMFMLRNCSRWFELKTLLIESHLSLICIIHISVGYWYLSLWPSISVSVNHRYLSL